MNKNFLIAASISIGSLFINCAKFQLHRNGYYKYKDIDDNEYSMKFIDGNVLDTLILRDRYGSILRTKYRKLNNEYEDNYNFGPREKGDQCVVVDTTKRTTESILKVIRKEASNLKSVYNRHLVPTKFAGKITIQFHISPSGKIIYLYLVSDETRNIGFTQEILENIKKWKFEKINNCLNDIVTVPLTFSE